MLILNKNIRILYNNMSRSRKRSVARYSRKRKISGGCGGCIKGGCKGAVSLFSKGGCKGAVSLFSKGGNNIIPLNPYLTDDPSRSYLTGGNKKSRKNRKNKKRINKKKGGSFSDILSSFGNQTTYNATSSPAFQPNITNYYSTNVPMI
jgi:hypothetical protein